MRHEGFQLTPRRGRFGIFLFLGFGAVLCAAAMLVGISDNPAGILLAFGSVACLILAGCYRWRRPKPFALLLLGSLVGFVAGAVLHNLLYAVGQAWPDLPQVVLGLVEALHVVFFLLAVLVCPPGVVIGFVGLLWMGARTWFIHRQTA